MQEPGIIPGFFIW